MNALRPTLATAMKKSPVRRFSSAASAVPHAKKTTFKENWLSDPSVYPIIVVMGGAVTLVGGIFFHSLVINKDVQIDPRKRNSILRNWGAEEHATLPSVATHLTAKVTRRPTWIVSNPEGLGIDHDKWLKEHDK